MQRVVWSCLWMLVCTNSSAQTPFEVSFFRAHTSYFAYTQRDIDSAGKWNMFSQANFTKHHNEASANSLSIDNLLSRQISRMLGVTIGASFDGEQLTPTVGLSLEYLSPDETFYLNCLPSYLPIAPSSLDLFLMVQYAPPISRKWSLFFQLIATTNHWIRRPQSSALTEAQGRFPRHQYSQQQWRAGIGFRARYQMGLAFDSSQEGANWLSFTNFGLFLRLQLD